MDKNRTIGFILLIMVTYWYTDHLARRHQEAEAHRKAAAQSQAQAARALPPPPAVVQPGVTQPGVTQPGVTQPGVTPPGVTQPAAPVVPPVIAAVPAPAAVPEEGAAVERIITVTRPEFEAVFSSRGAALIRYTLRNHYRTTEHREANRQVLLDAMDPTVASLRVAVVGSDVNVNSGDILHAVTLTDRIYHVRAEPGEDGEGDLVFETEAGGLRLTTTFRFLPDQPFGIAMSVACHNPEATPRQIVWGMDGVGGMVPDSNDRYFGKMQGLFATWDGTNNSITTHDVEGLQAAPAVDTRPLAWFGLKNRFFGAFLRAEEPAKTSRAAIRFLPPSPGYGAGDPFLQELLVAHPYSGATYWRGKAATCPPGGMTEDRFVFYGGPMRDDLLDHHPAFAGAVGYSWRWFDGICHVLLVSLQFMYGIIPNYGLCIILLTIIIKTLLHGLTRQAMRGQHEMQKAQPLMAELKRKYANDRQKLQLEMMRLYREHGISPFKSCMPIFFQIPIFIALYGTFSRAFAMRQAMFIPGWIEDLSLPDAFYTLPFTLPLLGASINLLPILSAAFQFWQQSMTPKSTDPQVAQSQAMMKYMPVFFMFILYNMPAGLSLYFIIQSLYTLVEHWFLRRQLGVPGVAGVNGAQDALPAAAGQGFAKKKK